MAAVAAIGLAQKRIHILARTPVGQIRDAEARAIPDVVGDSEQARDAPVSRKVGQARWLCCSLLTYCPGYWSSLAPRQHSFAWQQNANLFLRGPLLLARRRQGPLKERQKRILIATGIGILLTVANYTTHVLFVRLGISVADNPFDDLLLGTVGGLLAYIWVTLLEERESRIHLAEHIRQEALSEERNRMARELHDTLAQGFTGVVIQLEAAEDILTLNTETARAHILRARSLARESLSEARRSALALRLQALKDSDLPTALARFAAHLTAGTSVQAEFVLHGTARALPPEKEDNLLRITQEALTNVLRHANARRVRIDLSYNPRHVRLSIEDDGQGLNSVSGNGLGLKTMRERAEIIGGELSVSSRPGEGTRIDALVPVPWSRQQ